MILKSKLRKRIEVKRNDLIRELEDIHIEQIKCGTLDQKKYCHYSVLKGDIKMMINLLTKLLDEK